MARVLPPSLRPAAVLALVLTAAGCSADVFHDTDWHPRPDASSSGAGAGGPVGSGGSDGGGGLGTGASGAQGGAATTAGSGGSATCDGYCKQITEACVGPLAMYASFDVCAATCPAFPVGTSADTTGDTLGCRAYHAGAAQIEPTTHCEHAGPGGAGFCGTNCEGFCSLALAFCPAVFGDEMACIEACSHFGDQVPYNASVTSGDSLACRLYHATAAAVDPKTHCPHIAAMSASCI